MNPYQILGVSPDATDEEIRLAYRALAKKYHPDNYVNNPLADLAAEKMKQINTAYDEIRRMRAGGSQSTSPSGSASARSEADAYRSSANENDPQAAIYRQIRLQIANGNLDAADSLLNAMSVRSAEWLFLKGSVCYRRGWLDQASQYFHQAAAADPGNAEYAAACEQMSHVRSVYRERGQAAGSQADGCCAGCCDSCATYLSCLACCSCMDACGGR